MGRGGGRQRRAGKSSTVGQMMKTGLKSSSMRHYGMGARMVGVGQWSLGRGGGGAVLHNPQYKCRCLQSLFLRTTLIRKSIMKTKTLESVSLQGVYDRHRQEVRFLDV